ncbi:MAG TPA: 2-oxo acid dehydrogenase subunit E2, partial [Trueperaceae bacterium]|nr:2-oxo acid dehydrogenase subunit E2 [Trueperaceae bacterium]
MARELRLPELAESVVEGEIIRWLVAEGENVVLDQPVAEVLTDKATVELPSPYAGVLLKHLAAEGDVVAVNSAIALFSDGSEAAPAAASQPPSLQAAEERSIVEPGHQTPVDDGESLSLFKPSADEGGQALPQVTRAASATAVQAPPAARGAF